MQRPKRSGTAVGFTAPLCALGGLVLLACGLLIWARGETRSLLSQRVATHAVSFPMPRRAAGAGADALVGARSGDTAPATRHALERGEHLVRSRYGCVGCHGEDLSGGAMIESFGFGRVLAPNLTRGSGSRTAGYSATDWDRIVRHGVKPDGRPALMPSGGYARMSDRELADIVAYLHSLPSVDRHVPASTLGPFAWLAIASGEFPIAALSIADHHAPHLAEPPDATPSAAFGEHLAAVCTGCHRKGMEGGRIRTGPPTWPPAGNLTPHETGIGTWTFADFDRALRQGVRPDGRALQAPMTQMLPYAQRMTETEMRALWTYLRQLPPKATGT